MLCRLFLTSEARYAENGADDDADDGADDNVV